MEAGSHKADIAAYLESLDVAERSAQEKNLSEGLKKGIGTVRESLIDLEPHLKTEHDYKRLKADVKGLMESLVQKCDRGDQTALGEVRQLRDLLRFLKHKYAK